jgi:hypothetical protein
MSEKHLVCHGATCQCKFGTTPDKLAVKTQSKRYINEKDGSKTDGDPCRYRTHFREKYFRLLQENE